MSSPPILANMSLRKVHNHKVMSLQIQSHLGVAVGCQSSFLPSRSAQVRVGTLTRNWRLWSPWERKPAPSSEVPDCTELIPHRGLGFSLEAPATGRMSREAEGFARWGSVPGWSQKAQGDGDHHPLSPFSAPHGAPLCLPVQGLPLTMPGGVTGAQVFRVAHPGSSSVTLCCSQ